jgi:peptidyl-prolyl cis-trans isomerase B (cyclophilin B)
MRLRRLAVLGLPVLLAAVACGSSSTSSGTQSVAALNANGCTKAPPLQTKHLTFAAEPKLTIARATYTARIVTNCGTILVALDGKDAPHTVNSFAFLAGKGYFNDTPCQRLVTTGIFVLQCGDPTGTGSGGPGYTIPDENLTNATYPAGTLAMANTGAPHTGGSQFFFVYANTSLPPMYTPFGHITTGLTVLTKIARAGDDNTNPAGGGHPHQPVVIESFSVAKS